MRSNKVTYKLINNRTGDSITLAHDPKNWDESEPKIKRSMKSFGITTEYSKNLEFVKEGKDFLNKAFDLHDIEAQVTAQRWKPYPHKDGEYLQFSMECDFSDYEPNELVVKIPFKTSGLNQLVKSQLKEKFELERLEAINGETIGELNTKTVALTSRDILLISKLETNDNDRRSTSFRMNFTDGNLRTGSLGIPTHIKVPSDAKLGEVIRDASFTANPNVGEITSMFYFNNDLEKELEIEIDLYCVVEEDKVDDLSNEFLKVDLARFENGVTPTLLDRTTLYSVPMGSVNGHVIDISYKDTITLLAGQSLSLQWYGGGNFGGFLNDGDLKVNFNDTAASITITENSSREDSQSKAVLIHDAGDKLAQIITGEQGRYYSEFYGREELGYENTGEFSLTACALGLWLRQFNDKPIEMSLDSLLDTTNVIHGTGWTIEKINGIETIVHEDLKYFFQEDTVIDLGEVTDLESKVAKEFYNSNISIGYKQPSGDNLYEEAMGLDEYNTNRSYTLPFTTVTTKYNKISPFRADPYGKEFARRKSQFNYPEDDTRYDNHIHLLDLKEGLGTALEERIWSDDFDSAPNNVYSPETATNLRITPFRCLERHEWFFGSGLTKKFFQDKSIRYANGLGNNELSTQRASESTRVEKGDKLISEIEKPRFLPMWKTFNYEMTHDISQALYAKTERNGRKIPNVFFKCMYTHKGVQKYGYLFETTLTDKAKAKLLEAR